MFGKYIIGIDLGGTNLRLALLDLRYRILSKEVHDTRRFRTKAALINAITDSINAQILRKKLRKSAILGVGLGLPGPIDTEKGIVYFFPNIPGWKNVNLLSILKRRLRLPVFLDNDANLMSLGEYALGAARGATCAVCITLGTGVGGGIVIDGEIFRGKSNITGEIGHMPINEAGPRCNCGGRACLEAYVGNNRIMAQAKEVFNRDISLEELSSLARRKDPRATKIWSDAGMRLGIALTAVVNLLNPDRIVIGGGVANAGKILFDKIKKTVKERAMPVQARDCKIVKARLGTEAGLVGAALLVRRRSKDRAMGFRLSGLIIAFLLLTCHVSIAQQYTTQETQRRISGSKGFMEESEASAGGTIGAASSEDSEEAKKQPIEVNGDKVEYIPGTSEFCAEGNVVVNFKGTILTCDKLLLNTVTKDGLAEGHVRLEEKAGIIEGSKMSYNFNTKAGLLMDSEFRANPYFGHAEKVEKLGESEFIARYGYFTTCSIDNPHYRMKMRKVTIFPKEKLLVKDVTAFAGKVPLLYLPQYNHSFKDPLMHVQLMPGKRKEWGPYMLSAWRYQITDNLAGRINFDARQKLGLSGGVGANYKTDLVGKGDFKYYYTPEVDTTLPEGARQDFNRYLLRLRHRWDIDETTNLLAEYYKIYDAKKANLSPGYNFLKDYFYRDYEKDVQPGSYISIHRTFAYSSLDMIFQPRTNDWFNTMTEKLPEISYSLPSLRIASTPFFYGQSSTFSALKVSYPKESQFQSAPPPEQQLNKFDTTNSFSLPSKVAIFQFTPFVASRNTFFDKGVDGESLLGSPRTVFSTGAGLSTKFFRLFNLKSKILGLNLDGLRHVVTPTVSYTYQHEPTLANSRLKPAFESGVNVSNGATFEVSNKLQTKRNDKKVDIMDLIVSNTFNAKTGDGNKRGGGISDFLIKWDLMPYSWARLYSEATYSSENKYFSSVNTDLTITLGSERTFSIGQRYQRKGGHEVVYSFGYRLNPKWRLSFYQRYEIGSGAALKRGLREQEYSLSRDLHCWTMEMTYNVTRDRGESIWIVMRLKAFPALEFNFDQNYHAPKPGSLSQ